MIKRIVLVVLGLVLLLVLAVVGAVAAAFIGSRPLEPGAVGPAEIVVDSHVSVGLVDTGAGVILIDCGNSTDGAALKAALGDRAVLAVFLTHGHGDHVGACHLLPGARIYAMAAEVDHIEGRERPRGPLPRLVPLAARPFTVTDPLQDGQIVQVGETIVEAFHVPGHTVGSAAYLIDGALFFGDSAGASTEGTLDGAPWVFTDDTAQNRASLAALADRLRPRRAEITHLIFSHTGALTGSDALMAWQP